jgi:hypothetical protein
MSDIIMMPVLCPPIDMDRLTTPEFIAASTDKQQAVQWSDDGLAPFTLGKRFLN